MDQADPVSMEEQLLARDLTFNELKENLLQALSPQRKI